VTLQSGPKRRHPRLRHRIIELRASSATGPSTNQDMNWKTGAVTDSSGNANTGQLIGIVHHHLASPGKMGQGSFQWDERVCECYHDGFNKAH